MILLELTPGELRALLDADFSAPEYPSALAKGEQALAIEEGSGGFYEIPARSSKSLDSETA